MKIELFKFSTLPSGLPKSERPKLKIYIAYKSGVSRYIAYAIFKIISESHFYEFGYDRAYIGGGDFWGEKLEACMNQCDIVLVIGQRGMLDYINKGIDDEFIKEIKSGYEKGKMLLYVSVDRYYIAEECGFSELLSEDEKNAIMKIHSFHVTTLDHGQNIAEFEEPIVMMQGKLDNNYEEYFGFCKRQRLSQESYRQSTIETQRENSRGQSLL